MIVSNTSLRITCSDSFYRFEDMSNFIQLQSKGDSPTKINRVVIVNGT